MLPQKSSYSAITSTLQDENIHGILFSNLAKNLQFLEIKYM